MPPTDSLVERLQAYCFSKLGVSVLRADHVRYELIYPYFTFAEFFPEKESQYLELRFPKQIVENDPQKYNDFPISDRLRYDDPNRLWLVFVLDQSLTETTLKQFIDLAYDYHYVLLDEQDKQLLEILRTAISVEAVLPQLVELNQLSHRFEEIQALFQPAILLRTRKADESEMALGQSKIGGHADLPVGWELPTIDGKPLSFLAQINLSEIPPDLDRGPLPNMGLLYFFSGYAWQWEEGGFHSDLLEYLDDDRLSRVLYVAYQPDQLIRQMIPGEMKVFRAAAVDFVQISSFPITYFYMRDIALTHVDWTEEESDHLDHLYEAIEYIGSQLVGCKPKHQLLGYADTIQSELTEADTRLLLQIDSDLHDLDTDMHWIDVGMIYFIISNTDLENLNFSNIQSDMQFS